MEHLFSYYYNNKFIIFLSTALIFRDLEVSDLGLILFEFLFSYFLLFSW